MDQDTRNKLQRATQQVRRILEEEFAEQLEGTFDMLPDGKILPEPGKHLDAQQRLTRRKLVAAIEHIKAGGKSSREAVGEYTREAAFTFLNRFVALRMLEARGMLQECVSKGNASSGFKEFCGLAPGLSSLDDGGYRLYLECLFDELTVEVKVLFDRQDPASLLWPRRGALTELLDILSEVDLAGVWSEDETIGWIYQHFNSREEISEMRESDAPQNCRELAVRNQFFTPRYVVEFLTDNTLGHIWYEMRQGQTRLVDECRYLVRRPSEGFLNEGQEPPTDDSEVEQEQSRTTEEPLRKTVYIRHRAKKDPRDLKILDPACGSGHFLLYAFDLLISIYEEGWHDEASPKSEGTGRRLRDDYTELEQLHAALPGLVLRHNLHGIDIDPRAAQIAAFALWTRGQRAYNDLGVARERRPTIAKSGIVCSEPMPGEKTLLFDFFDRQLSDTPEEKLLGQLVDRVFESMKLAGVAGSLLAVEHTVSQSISAAKELWQSEPQHVQTLLFQTDDRPQQQTLEFDVTGITDESFWEQAEQHIYQKLRQYSNSAGTSGRFLRTLFADDTAKGFAFVDTCRARYDVILTNPPFGTPASPSKKYVHSSFPTCKDELYAAFVERGLDLLVPGGRLGAITSRSGFFRSTFEKWREQLLFGDNSVTTMADLGYGVLDAKVETAAYCVSKGDRLRCSDTPTICIRLLAASDKAESLERAITAVSDAAPDQHVYVAKTSAFRSIPGSPMAYSMPPRVLSLFASDCPFQNDRRHVRTGLETRDDFRFVRAWWEVAHSTILDCDLGESESLCDYQTRCRARSTEQPWSTFAKGGKYAPYFSDFPFVINWRTDGAELKAFAETTSGTTHWSRNLRNYNSYFRRGLTFLARTSIKLCVYPLPFGSIISHGAGPGIYVEGDDLYWALARFNSLTAEYLLSSIHTRGSEGDDQTKVYTLGALQQLPWPARHAAEKDDEVKQLTIMVASIRTAEEQSRHYGGYRRVGLEEFVTCAEKIWEIEQHVADAYGVDANTVASNVLGTSCKDRIVDAICKQLFISGDLRDALSETESYLSYAFGSIVGRWKKPTGEIYGNRNVAPPNPFAATPSMPPAGDKERGGRSIIVDDEGHGADLIELLRECISADSKRKGNDNWPAAGNAISEGTRLSLRDWFRKRFFEQHIKTYTRTPRKAPIYWQLATTSSSYSVWLYYHRFTRDTFFEVLNDYVKPKLNHERKKLERARSEGGAEPTRSQLKAIEVQEKFVAELASMVEEVERIAPLWNPNLNDGVIINFAPLWRLVPQHKSWQKECKKVWDKLVKGDYDWAHLAMHLWPERVVPKCVTDASLAIAHGLEEVFWEQDDRDHFQAKDEPAGGWDPVVKELVDERTSAAVKAALESLLTAPVAAKKSTRRKKAKAS